MIYFELIFVWRVRFRPSFFLFFFAYECSIFLTPLIEISAFLDARFSLGLYIS